MLGREQEGILTQKLQMSEGTLTDAIVKCPRGTLVIHIDCA